MRAGDKIKLNMKQALYAGMILDDAIHEGQLHKFDETEECLYLVLTDVPLQDISLDAIYECEIVSENERMLCAVRVRERYKSEVGKTLKAEIKNGFYKINIK